MANNLSDTKIRAAIRAAIKSGEGRKLYDGLGLYLQLVPRGKVCGAWWRQRYFWVGKEQLLSVGTYPDVSLALARDKRDEMRKLIAQGKNPSADRQQKKAEQRSASERLYEPISLEWLEHTAKFKGWTDDHVQRVRRRQEVHFWPWLGRKGIAEITDDEVLACVLRISDKGLLDTAYRARAEVDAIFRYAKKRKLVKVNPVADLRGADVLPKHKVEHHAAIKDPALFGALLRALDTYPGGFTVRCALQFQALVFVRPGELRLARWEEFDLAGAEWRIPGLRMKMGEHHVVPLSRQALQVLRALHPLTGPDGFVFPQVRNASRPISNNTLNAALRTLGYTKAQASAHGFRSTAATLLNESGKWHADAIERQLAHGERNKVRGAYNSAQHLPERRKMMQTWADYLDELRAGEAKRAA